MLLFTNDGDFATAMTEIGNISRYYNCSLRYHGLFFVMFLLFLFLFLFLRTIYLLTSFFPHFSVDNDTDKQKGWTYDKDDKFVGGRRRVREKDS